MGATDLHRPDRRPCVSAQSRPRMAEGELHEDMPSVPTIAYPIAKNNLRLFLQNLKNEFSFSLKWMRIFYLHGAGQSPKSFLS